MTVGGGGRPNQSVTLKHALESSLNVDIADCEWTLWASDIHFTALAPYTTKLDGGIVRELLALAANPPESIVIGGDVFTSYALAFGYGPYTVYGTPESVMANLHMPKFSTLAPLRCILGNHDTGPNEDPVDSFIAANSGAWYNGPHHSWTTGGGVHCIAISTSHDAALEVSGGKAYLEGVLDAITDDLPVIIYIHQPAIASVNAEYGMREGIVAAMPAGFSNEITIVAGHNHVFNDVVYSIESTTIHQWTVGPVSPDTSLNPDGSKPCMGALILKDGAILCRAAFLARTGTWVILEDISRASPATLPVILSAVTGTIVQVTVDSVLVDYYKEGHYDRAGKIISTENAEWRDTGTWLADVDDIVVKFPLPAAADQFFVSTSRVPTATAMSIDGSAWTNVTGTDSATAQNFPIPVAMQGETNLWFRGSFASGSVGGWGFATL